MEVDKIVNTEYIPPKKSGRPPGSKNRGPAKGLTKQIIEIKTRNPDLSAREIAEIVDCCTQNVNQTLKRHGIDRGRIKSFREVRADLLSGYQDKILKAIKKEDYKKASLKDKTIAFSILYDKERLEIGKSTQNISLAKVVETIDKDNE